MGFILFYSRNDFILISRQRKMKKELKKDEGLYAFLRKAAIRFEFFYPTTIISSKKNQIKTAQQKSISHTEQAGSV